MKHIDLEMYRWKFHNDIYLPSIRGKTNNTCSMAYWWQEYGAFVSTLPRQVGKTSMLGLLVNYFSENNEFYMLVAPNKKMADNLISKTRVSSKNITLASDLYNHCFNGVQTSIVNILVDEYQFLERAQVANLLDNNWKSVTMVGTLRI